MEKISPIERSLMTLKAMAGLVDVDRSDVFNDKIGDVTVDTVCAFDTHTWETGIEQNGEWIIVEQYEDREKAKTGHQKWVEKIKKDPKQKLKDCGVWEGMEDG
jgi:hypothetical protein